MAEPHTLTSGSAASAEVSASDEIAEAPPWASSEGRDARLRASARRSIGRAAYVGLVLSHARQHTHSHLPAPFLDGLNDQLALHDLQLCVSRLTDHDLTSGQLLGEALREHTCAGLLVNYTHDLSPALLQRVQAQCGPVVWVNSKLEANCVYPDDEGAARAVTDHLLALGHRRIAMVHLIARLGWSGTFEGLRPRMHYSAVDRSAGYAAALEAVGLSPWVLAQYRFIEEAEHVQACRTLLTGQDRPTAVLAYSERELHAVIRAARQLGLEIPRDLTVVAFAPTATPVLGYRPTIAAVPAEQVARRAVRMLLRRMKAPAAPCGAESISYDLAEGQTVAPVPA